MSRRAFIASREFVVGFLATLDDSNTADDSVIPVVLGWSDRTGDLGVRPPSGGAELAADLRDHYRDSDAALAQLLGRELPWRRKDS